MHLLDLKNLRPLLRKMAAISNSLKTSLQNDGPLVFASSLKPLPVTQTSGHALWLTWLTDNDHGPSDGYQMRWV